MLSDNGKQFTGRFGRPWPATEVLFDRICRENGITHRLTGIRSPTTTVKVKRSHQSLRRELRDDHPSFVDLAAAQAAIEGWRHDYNTSRPHQSLDMATPASRFRPAPADGLPLRLRLLNQGLTGAEIAETIELPPALRKAWSTPGYYGSVSHNVKAIYQRYMGWFDGNPARLWPHPPAELATRYVAAMGGIDRVVELARSAYDDGDYRWAAKLLGHAVFADEKHAAARALYADTLEQLAYGAENGTWRNFFLSGTTELRESNFGTPAATAAPAVLAQLSPEQLFDSVAISVNGPAAWDLDLDLDVTLADLGKNYRLTLRNGVLIHIQRAADGTAAALTLTKARLLGLLAGDISSPGIDIAGDPTTLNTLLSVLEEGDPSFNIVTP